MQGSLHCKAISRKFLDKSLNRTQLGPCDSEGIVIGRSIFRHDRRKCSTGMSNSVRELGKDDTALSGCARSVAIGPPTYPYWWLPVVRCPLKQCNLSIPCCICCSFISKIELVLKPVQGFILSINSVNPVHPQPYFTQYFKPCKPCIQGNYIV
jgi:hypothetical protein